MKSLYCIKKKITTARLKCPGADTCQSARTSGCVRNQAVLWGTTKQFICDQCLRLYTSFTNLILHNLILLLNFELLDLFPYNRRAGISYFPEMRYRFTELVSFFVCFQVLEN